MQQVQSVTLGGPVVSYGMCEVLTHTGDHINYTVYIVIAYRYIYNYHIIINDTNKRPLTPKSMPPTGGEHAKLKT